MHHPNLMYFGRNSSSSKVVDFYQEIAEKQIKQIHPKGVTKSCAGRDMAGMPFPCPLLVSRNLWVWPGVAHSTGASLAKSHNEIKENRAEGKKIHMAPLFATVYCYKEGLNTYQISKPFRDV